MRFTEPELLNLFLRKEAMIESPVIKEIVEDATLLTWRSAIEEAVTTRAWQLSADARARLQGLKDEGKMRGLLRFAMTGPSLEAFVERLGQDTTPPAKPVSSRRKRKD